MEDLALFRVRQERILNFNKSCATTMYSRRKVRENPGAKCYSRRVARPAK